MSKINHFLREKVSKKDKKKKEKRGKSEDLEKNVIKSSGSEKKLKEKEEKKEELTEKSEAEEIKTKKPIFKNIFLAIFLLLFLLVCTAIGLYLYSPLEKYARPVFKNVPYPVAIVGSHRDVITSRALIQNTDAVRNFYENQDLSSQGYRVDFKTDDGELRLKIKEKDVLDKLVENSFFKEFANQKGIFITNEEAQKEIDKNVAERGDMSSLELSLKSLYGWDINDFRDNVVIPQLYMRKLFAAYSSEVTEQDGYKKSFRAREKIKDDGSNFVEVVKEFSEGESLKVDGELGWFRYHQLIPEVSDVAFQMEVGEISDVIVSPVGFHIIQVEEKRESPITEEGEVGDQQQTIPELRLRQVYVHGETFLNWIFDQKKKEPVIVLMKGYSWNAETGHIEFSDELMKKNEKKVRINSQGDPSIGNAQ